MQKTPQTEIEEVKDSEIDNENGETTEEIIDPKVISRAELNKVIEDKRLPKVPGKKPSPDEAELWFKNLEPSAYNRLAPYVYRVHPVINKRMLDPKADVYIEILTESVFEEGLENYLTRVHGGGKYKIIVNDIEAPQVRGANSSTLMTFYINITFDKAMPKIDYKELDLNARENAGYIVNLKNIGVLNSKGELVSNQQNNNNNGESVGTAEAMGKMFMSLYKEMNANQQAQLNAVLKGNETKKDDPNGVGNLLLEKLKQDDPNKQVTTMLQMAKELKGEGGNGIKELLPLLTLLLSEKKQDGPSVVEIMTKSHQQQMELMSKLIDAKATKPEGDSFVDSLLKFAKLKEAMPEMFGNSGNGEGRHEKKQTAELIIDAVKEIGLPALGLASQFFQMKGFNPLFPTTPAQAEQMVRQSGLGGQPTQSPQPPQQNNPTQQLAPPVNGQPTPPTADANVVYMVGTQTPLTDPTQATVCQKFLFQYGGLLMNALNDPEMTGFKLADSLVAMQSMLGIDAYGQLKNEGKSSIIQAMQSIPAFWNQTGMKLGEPKVNEMLDEFMKYEEIVATMDDDDEDDDEEGNNKGKGA
jgi:hypothetical protein